MKFKVGELYVFSNDCHNEELYGAVIKITAITQYTMCYDIIKAPNTKRKSWSSGLSGFNPKKELRLASKLERVLK